MCKRNPEILRFEIALQDFAEFAIIIHYEQVRLDLLRRPTGSFPCVCAQCVLILLDGSDESFLKHDRSPKQNPNEEIPFPHPIVTGSPQQYDTSCSGPLTTNATT